MRGNSHARCGVGENSEITSKNYLSLYKNVITRIETNKRHVTDVELKAFTEIFHVSYEYLIDGKEKS